MTLLQEFYSFVVHQFKEYSILNLAAQLSYRVLLAFIPFVMLLYNLMNWLTHSFDDHLLQNLNTLLAGIFDNFFIIAAGNAPGPQTSLWTNLVFCFFIFYASVCAARSVMLTFDKVMLLSEKRNYFLTWGLAILNLIIFIFFIVIIFYFYIFTQKIAIVLLGEFQISHFFIEFWRTFTFIYASSIIALLISGVYMYAPAKKLSFFNAFPGGVFTSLGWFSIIGIHKYFSKTQLQKGVFFSTIEGPFSLILVVYAFCIILTFGCLINFFLEKRSAPITHEKNSFQTP